MECQECQKGYYVLQPSGLTTHLVDYFLVFFFFAVYDLQSKYLILKLFSKKKKNNFCLEYYRDYIQVTMKFLRQYTYVYKYLN